MVENAVDVARAVKCNAVFLLLINLLSETFKDLVGRKVLVTQPFAQFVVGAADAWGLVNADLFCHSQVHREVKEWIAFSRFHRIIFGQHVFDVGIKSREVLRMSAHPLKGNTFCVGQRLLLVVFFPGVQEKKSRLISCGVKHRHEPSGIRIEQTQTESIVSGRGKYFFLKPEPVGLTENTDDVGVWK